MKEYASHGYSGQMFRTMAIKYPWLTSCNPDFEIATVTGHQPLCETSATVRDSNTLSVTGHWRILSYVLVHYNLRLIFDDKVNI